MVLLREDPRFDAIRGQVVSDKLCLDVVSRGVHLSPARDQGHLGVLVTSEMAALGLIALLAERASADHADPFGFAFRMAFAGGVRLQLTARRTRFAFSIDGLAAVRARVFSHLHLAVFVGYVQEAGTVPWRQNKEAQRSWPLRLSWISSLA